MKKGGYGFNDINERLVGNEQKLVFTIQKFPQMVGVRTKQKVVNAREKKVTPFATTYMFVNIFLKTLKLQVDHGVTLGSVVRHPWHKQWHQYSISFSVAHSNSMKCATERRKKKQTIILPTK